MNEDLEPLECIKKRVEERRRTIYHEAPYIKAMLERLQTEPAPIFLLTDDAEKLNVALKCELLKNALYVIPTSAFLDAIPEPVVVTKGCETPYTYSATPYIPLTDEELKDIEDILVSPEFKASERRWRINAEATASAGLGIGELRERQRFLYAMDNNVL